MAADDWLQPPPEGNSSKGCGCLGTRHDFYSIPKYKNFMSRGWRRDHTRVQIWQKLSSLRFTWRFGIASTAQQQKNPNVLNTVNAQTKCGVDKELRPVGELRNTARRQSEQRRALPKDFCGSRCFFSAKQRPFLKGFTPAIQLSR